MPSDPVCFVPSLAAGRIALPAAAQEVTLKVHHFWPPTAMPPSTLLMPWCDKIAKESNNRMKCQIYPAMQLGGTPPQLIQQAMDGVADIVWTLPGYTAGRFPIMEVFELPFMSQQRRGDEPGGMGLLHAVRLQGVPRDQGARRQRARQRLRPHRRQAGQGDGRLQGPEDARADAADEQAAGRARRDACRDAAAGARRCVVEGRGRRLHAAVGSDSVDQGARVHEVRKRDRSRSRARSTRRCSSSR